MKKVVLFISALFLIFSCAEEEEGGTVLKIEPSDLIGQWVLISAVENGEVITLDECDAQDNIIFSTETFTEEFFYWNEAETECYSESFDISYSLVGSDGGLEMYVIDELGDQYYEGFITISGDQLTLDWEDTDGSIIVESATYVYEKQ